MLGLFKSNVVGDRRLKISTIKDDLNERWDLSRHFTLPGEGEADGLIDAMNLIFSRLHAFVFALTKGSVETATVAPKAQAIAGKVRSSSESLSHEVEQIEQTCSMLAQGIGTSADSAGQALVQSARIVGEIELTAQLTEQALQRMHAMDREVNQLTGAIGELDRRSRDIGSIIESISDIADHTGLLSLNAFIEAARAGVHGAGFGVIAQEIRQLSQETTKAAQEVKNSLLGISELIGETVTAVSRVQNEVGAGLTGSSEATVALTQVSREHHSFHQHLQTVITAVEDQKKAVARFADDLAHISAIGKEGRLESNELAKLADQVKQLTDQQLLSTSIFILPQYRKAEKAVLAMAQSSAIQTPGRGTDQVLQEKLASLPYLELIYLTDSHGVQISSNVFRNGRECTCDLKAKGKNWSQKEWFRKVRETGKPYISQVYTSEATDSFCLTISVPVHRNGIWVGVLAADINFEDLLRI
ncbi:MAG: methyl-accepting chemotaxis protein [Desulfobulbus sp.]|nr:methyl-accepting chemotaxis protein [Desulfobulbus sp.]